MEISDLKIGRTIFIINNEESKSIRKRAKLKIVGLFYEGLSGNSEWRTLEDLLEDQKLFVQYIVESKYIFSNPSIYQEEAVKFINDINKDQMLLPKFRKYQL